MRHLVKALCVASSGLFLATAPAHAQVGEGRSWPSSAFIGQTSDQVARETRRPTKTATDTRTSRKARNNETRQVASVAGSLGGGSVGIASYYWQGQRVASGGWFNPSAMTAAHKTLPFGTKVRVTHLGNGRSVDVVINDRGPFIAGRIIDLSKGAAGIIGMHGQGLANVRMEVLGR